MDKSQIHITNAISAFRRMIGTILGSSHEGKRNVYDVYGYPQSLAGDEGFRLMYQYSRRQGIGNRLTFGMSKFCWRKGIELYENCEKDSNKILIDELKFLAKSKIFNYIERADVLNRIGRFSVLYLGIPDGKKSQDPLTTVVNGSSSLDKLFFRAYAYDSVKISQWEDDQTSPRYGLPKIYTLTFHDKDQNQNDVNTRSIEAHWTRVIHFNENGLESDIEGMGYLEPIFNNLLDLDKVCGGSAEAYFRNARGKIAYEFDKEFGDWFNENEKSKEAFQKLTEEFTNNYKDHITMTGAKTHTLDTPHYTPKDTIMGAFWVISGYTGWPIRVLIGEGSGQLAGSEDRLAMNNLIVTRQNGFCKLIINEILMRLEKAGMLALPKTYDIRFPLQDESSEDQKVDNNKKRAETFKIVSETLEGLDGAVDAESAYNYFGFSDIELNEIENFLNGDNNENQQPNEN